MIEPTLYRYATAGEILDGMYRELPVVRAEPTDRICTAHSNALGLNESCPDWDGREADRCRYVLAARIGEQL